MDPITVEQALEITKTELSANKRRAAFVALYNNFTENMDALKEAALRENGAFGKDLRNQIGLRAPFSLKAASLRASILS